MRTFTASLAALATLASQANAFWGTAHFLVSRYAEIILEAEYPEILDAALEQLVALQESHPELTVDEGKHPFTECANFADNIKGQGYSFQSDWHFKDQPYYDEGGDPSDYSFVMAEYNVVDALTGLVSYLRGEAGSEDNYYVQTIEQYIGNNQADVASFALRLVVHYLGDIHQPLHITAEVDSEYPAGDKGGNKESLPNHGGAYNLHSVWDSIIYEYTGYPRTPLHDSDWTWYTLEAEDLATNYPYDSDLLYPEQYQQWADEGLEISIEDVYPGIVEDQMPTEAYQLKALDALRPRIIIGGRRLADLIVNIYDKQVKFLSE